MRISVLRLLAIAVMIAVSVSAAYAVTIYVPPAGAPNWTQGKMGTSGTAMRGSSYQYWPTFDPVFNNAGWVSNPYAMTCGGGSKVGTCNLGTDLFKGKQLADVVELSYTCFMQDAAHAGAVITAKSLVNPHPEYGDGRAWGLDLSADKGDGNIRGLAYIPRTLTSAEYNTWVTINPLTEGYWRNPVSSSTGLFDWAGVKATMLSNSSFYSGTIAAGETRSYADYKSVSGKTFNFCLGSRVTSAAGLGDANYWQSWYNSAGFIGSLTIRFAGESEATTYIFIPEPGSLAAVAAGLIGLLGICKRRKLSG